MPTVRILLLCIFAAVAYGVMHDQFTARLCLEYFTVAHPPAPLPLLTPTAVALYWGFAATWWVGAGLGLLLAVVCRAGSWVRLSARDLRKPTAVLLGTMGLAAALAGAVAFQFAQRGQVDLGDWAEIIPAERHAGFVAAYAAHLTSYAVGILGGLLVALWAAAQRRQRQRAATFPRSVAPATLVLLLLLGGLGAVEASAAAEESEVQEAVFRAEQHQRETLARRYFGDLGEEGFMLSYLAQQLAELGEPPLTSLPGEHYRVMVSPSFHPQICCHLTVGADGRGELRGQTGSCSGLPAPYDKAHSVQKRLSRAAVAAFTQHLQHTDFWAQPQRESGGIDGTTWLFEAKVGPSYRVFTKWGLGSTDEFGRLGMRLLEMAGLSSASTSHHQPWYLPSFFGPDTFWLKWVLCLLP